MADKYVVVFPKEFDTDMKALILAAVQFIDMTAFEFNYCGLGTI